MEVPVQYLTKFRSYQIFGKKIRESDGAESRATCSIFFT
eukprot:SAG11_NODE_22676_length_402_cov_0.676568_1_plen_38_part_01